MELLSSDFFHKGCISPINILLKEKNLFRIFQGDFSRIKVDETNFQLITRY